MVATLSTGLRGHSDPEHDPRGAERASNRQGRRYIGPLTRKPQKAVFGVFGALKANRNTTRMPISSATRPTRLVGVSNGPIRWGEAMRIRGLGPSLLSSPSWVNRAKEALDASPHPNGLNELGAIGLGMKWDGPKTDSSRVYKLHTHPGRYRPFWAQNSGYCRRGYRTDTGVVRRATSVGEAGYGSD